MKGDRNIFKKYREKMNLTQEELAEKIGISQRQLQRIEAGETTSKICTLKKLIKVLQINDEDIIKILTNK